MSDDDLPERVTPRMLRPNLVGVLRGLLRMYAASTSGALADALQSFIAPAVGASVACVFLDDGSGVLAPLSGESGQPFEFSAVRLSIVGKGPVSAVLERGETIVSDNPADVLGDAASAVPARRVMLYRLVWEDEKLGVVLFGDGGDGTDLELSLEVAEHLSLALVRLRALKRTYRYGGIDPTRWMFDREWFEARLEEETARSKRYGHPLALLLFSFRNLDELAEKAGRQQSEVFLRRLAAVIRGEIRTPDILAAFGDAGIAALLPETARSAAVAIQQRIAARVLQVRPVGPDFARWSPDLLTGLAAYPEDGDSAGALIAAAESSLARAGQEELEQPA